MNREKEWNTGHIEPWWDDEFKSLEFKYRPLTNTDDEARWIKEGYDYFQNLNGMTFMMQHGMPDYAFKFFNLFDWKNQGLVYFKMLPGDALPYHRDAYNTYRKIFKITDPKLIFRCIVFLEDWKSGHYFEIENYSISNWKKGDYVYWNSSVPHFVANIGTEPRYTMQITGHK